MHFSIRKLGVSISSIVAGVVVAITFMATSESLKQRGLTAESVQIAEALDLSYRALIPLSLERSSHAGRADARGGSAKRNSAPSLTNSARSLNGGLRGLADQACGLDRDPHEPRNLSQGGRQCASASAKAIREGCRQLPSSQERALRPDDDRNRAESQLIAAHR